MELIQPGIDAGCTFIYSLSAPRCLLPFLKKQTRAHGPRNYDIHPVNPWGLAILLYNACCPKGAGLVPKTLLLQLKIKCMNRRLHCISSLSMWILVFGKNISHGRTAKHNSANSPSTHKREVLIKWPRHSASKSGASNTCDCTPPKTILHFIANCPKPKKSAVPIRFWGTKGPIWWENFSDEIDNFG